MENSNSNAGLALDELEPPYDDPTQQPKTLTRNRHMHDRQILYVAGRAPVKDQEQYDIMFVTTAVEEDEATQHAVTTFGFRINQPAEYLKGPTGIIKDVALRSGLDLDQCYYTAVCKWLLPRTKRTKPSVKTLKWGLPILMDEIKRVKPKIIVCMGKHAFDLLSDRKIGFNDAHGGWFWSTEANAHLYLMYSPYMLVAKPELHEVFRIDFTEIKRKKDILAGADIGEIPWRFEVLRDEQSLRDWVFRMQDLADNEWPGPLDAHGHKLIGVDGEWHGRTHVNGNLRTIQFAWSESDAVVVEFRNERNEWSFELDPETEDGLLPLDNSPEALEYQRYRAVGSIIGSFMNRQDVRYVGHHFSADSPWMEHWLGLHTYRRCVLDTEFAQQAIDEASELGLERGIAMKYTNLGLYCLDLVLWKKDNPRMADEGYGFIPSSILHPYACLAWDSMVQLGDGSWERIHKLVQSRYTGSVMALVDGKVKPCAVTNWKKTKKVGQRWFRVVTSTTRGSGPGGGRKKQEGDERSFTGPRFTEDHKILTARGMVRVDQLMVGIDKIATADRKFTREQRQIVLGSMLGDGGLYRPNKAGVRFRFSQFGVRVNYARWKAVSLGSCLTFNEYNIEDSTNRSTGLGFESRNHAEVAELSRVITRSKSQNGHFEITEEILEELGDLGLAVWFMDDGVRQGQHARIIRTSASPEEIRAGMKYFTKRFGRGVKWYASNGAFVFQRGAFYRLMDAIKPFVHPCMAYKHIEGDDIREEYAVDQSDNGVFYETVEQVVPADRHGGNKKMECFRYCLTVPEAGNFLTKVGFVSNCLDVITPLRAYPHLIRQMKAQQLTHYYDTILNPFVTDVFTSFAMTGLPMDEKLMDDLRELFHYAKGQLEIKFRERMHREARTHVVNKLMEAMPDIGLTVASLVLKAPDVHAALDLIKPRVPLGDIPKWVNLVTHLFDSLNFNIRSPDQMRRWLFDVEGLTPIKSTNQKAKGMPSMAWDKVLELPADRQRLYTPAVDKQTLQILSEQCSIVNELLDLNAVGNLCKAFLKEADVYLNDDGEETVEENGLHQWLARHNPIIGTSVLGTQTAGDGRRVDARVHCNYSLTGTGRPRSWRPNTLNWPSYVNQRISRSVMRVIKEAHEDGSLPESLLRWADCDEKSLPSIRSCVTAPEGWVLVESDYKTAEMVGLSVISGDKDLMRILKEPDPEWAVLKPGRPGPYVRVRYSDPGENGIPLENQKPEYLMSVWKDGKCLGQVTEDDIVRNPDGSFKHRGYDIHWSIAERIYEKPREEMIEKVQRNAGKVINFCVAEDELVLTHKGWKPIQRVLDCDLLWDGVEWVSHEGVIYSGRKEVIEYQGLRATELHDVWVEDGQKVKLGEASAKSLELVRSEATCPGYLNSRLADIPGLCSEERERLLLRFDALRLLRGDSREGAEKHGERSVVEVPMPRSGKSDEPVSWSTAQCSDLAGIALPGDGAAVSQGHSRVVGALQGARDHSRVLISKGLHLLGFGNLARRVVQKEGLRSDRQQRTVLEKQSQVGGSLYQSAEHVEDEVCARGSCQRVYGEAPAREVHGANSFGTASVRAVGGTNPQPALDEPQSRTAKVRVYDILNAGPRKRFTCQGVLVSNSSAYGASPASLERKIESDTGVKPEPGTGQKGLDAIKQRQPRATEFLEEMAEIPKTVGFYRAKSGRICHCVTHGAGSGVSFRTRNAVESALGRELKNYPMQESVGSTSARACIMALALYKNLGLKAVPMTCLYDSLVSLCPLEERFVVSRIHDLAMSELNTWTYQDEYGERMLKYEVDNEFNYRWSTRPNKEQQKQLDDPDWYPTPEKFKWILSRKNWEFLVS